MYVYIYICVKHVYMYIYIYTCIVLCVHYIHKSSWKGGGGAVVSLDCSAGAVEIAELLRARES